MSNDIERKVQKLLLENLEPMRVADELLKSWAKNELSLREQIYVCYFLFHAGFYPTIINQIKKNITAGLPVPWPALMQVLGLNAGLLDKALVDQILIGATEENFLDEIIFFPSLDVADSRFAKIRQRFYDYHKILPLPQKVPTLKPTAPKNTNLSPAQKNESKENNLEVDQMRTLLKKKEWEYFIEEKSRIVDEFQIGLTFVKKAQEEPELAYLISVSLYLMNCISDALNAIAFAPQDESVDWFKIQLLLENKLFLDALNQIEYVQNKYEENPDTISSSLLLKAKALWGLNDKYNAIEILELILKEVPQHFWANTLIREWRQEL